MKNTKISIKKKSNITNKEDNKVAIISKFTGKDNYFEAQYNKYCHDPYNVLNVITIKEQIEGFELISEVDYLKNLKVQLEKTSLENIIKEKELAIKNRKKPLNHNYLGTTYEFQKYFDKKREEFQNRIENTNEKKRKLERLRYDLKLKKIKTEKKKLENVNLTKDQKKDIINNIKNLEDIKNEPVIKEENNKVSIEKKNKFYPF
ncbi:MAG: hypothetical protein CMF62_03990 [Magnetococcales bacterium]|nr:hypothetical protein [Magnetococcales bacterium]|tara:strand:- start:2569 stop:3180 length:612 start_codon:yes stop_codon:yes gene_type:complete